MTLCSEEDLYLMIQMQLRVGLPTCGQVNIENIQSIHCERYLMRFKCNKSTSYAKMFTCALRIHTSEGMYMLTCIQAKLYMRLEHFMCTL
jgi:hypothetical protein